MKKKTISWQPTRRHYKDNEDAAIKITEYIKLEYFFPCHDSELFYPVCEDNLVYGKKLIQPNVLYVQAVHDCWLMS